MTNYHAYLIRFWRESDRSSWRASLVLPQTCEEHHFSSVDQAFAFLTNRLAEKDNEDVSFTDDRP